MFIPPANPVLKTWLLERHMAVEAEQGLVLSDEQAGHYERLREESKKLNHYNAEEKEAWAIFTAYTHAGTRVIPVNNSPDEIAPTLDLTKLAITRIAKATHGVATIVDQLPQHFASLDGLAESVKGAGKAVQEQADIATGIVRETARTLCEVTALATTAKTAVVRQAAMAAELATVNSVFAENCGQIENTSANLAGANKVLDAVAMQAKAAVGQWGEIQEASRKQLADSLEAATLVCNMLADIQSMGAQVGRATGQLKAIADTFPKGPIVVMAEPPAPSPVPFWQNPALVWLRWGVLVAALLSALRVH